MAIRAVKKAVEWENRKRNYCLEWKNSRPGSKKGCWMGKLQEKLLPEMEMGIMRQ